MWLAELAFGVLFWSLLTTFMAQVWFFPLEYMDITGYEAVVLFIFTPFALHLRPLRRLAQHPALHVVAAVGLVVAFHTQSLVVRAFVLAPATGLCVLATAARSEHAAPWLAWSAVLVMLDRLAGFSRSSVWTHAWAAYALLGATTLAAVLSPSSYVTDTASKKPTGAQHPSSLIVAVSLGSMLFLFHWFALQASVLPRWLDLPVIPAALSVALALPLGLLIGLPGGALFAVAPLLTAAWMLAAPSLPSVFAFVWSFASLWQPTVHMASPQSWGLALVVWFVHFLGSIWTVAYNFVPVGGELAREQTHVHLYIACGAAGLAAALAFGAPRARRSKQAWVVCVACLLLLAPIAWMRIDRAAAIAGRADANAAKDGNEIRSMIWAVHFGYNNHGQNSFESIEKVVRENNVNVIGLLESDLARPFNDNWDVVDWLSDRMGMYSDYGPSTLNNTWGCALLSVFPIVNSTKILLPSPLGELACLVDATLNVHGTHVRVFVTHFGNFRDSIDRELQTQEVAAMLQRSAKGTPHIYLGYLTNRPFSEHYNALVAAGWVDTAPTVLNRWCQYIFYRDLHFDKFYRYDTGDISDTEAQIAHFRAAAARK